MIGGMADLQRQYVVHLAERRAVLERLAKTGETQRLAPEQREELVAIAHRLAGTGATYGYRDISDAARDVELFAQKAPSTAALKLDTEEVAVLDALKRLIQAIIEAQTTSFALARNRAIRSFANPFQTDENRKPVVLVVDDDPYVRDVLNTLLQHIATVIMAKNSEQALRAIADECPDVVLLDDAMPGGLSGLELLEHIKTLPDGILSNTLVMMVTANNDTENFKRAINAGAVEYITKPFSIDVLQQKLVKRLERRQKTVLIVDDDPAAQSILAKAVLSAGFRARIAVDSVGAIDALEVEKPNLILLDQGLPGSDGISTLKKIRKDFSAKSMPVIMVTASRDTETVRRAKQAGANDYCAKPVKPADLVARCERQIG